MAVESIGLKRLTANRWRVLITVDGDELERAIIIPDPLPAEYATAKACMKAQVRQLVVDHRMVKQRDIDEAAALDGATNQSATAAEFLTDLQTELD